MLVTVDGVDILQEHVNVFFQTFKAILSKYYTPSQKLFNECLRNVIDAYESKEPEDSLIQFLTEMLLGYVETIQPPFSTNRKQAKIEQKNFLDFFVICLFGHIHDHFNAQRQSQ